MQKRQALGQRLSIEARSPGKSSSCTAAAGKLEGGPAPGPTNIWGIPGGPAGAPSVSRQSVCDLFRATPESAGLDLSSATYAVLTPAMGVQALPTGVHGPLPSGTVGLLLGRSSTTMRGLIVSPGVIDHDYTGEIKVMAHAPGNVVVIDKGQRVAQLLILPLVKVGKIRTEGARGTQGFGSSDAYWLQPIQKDRPEMELLVNGHAFRGILDTGADVSVISGRHWPNSWPIQPATTSLQGIGQSKSPYISSQLLSWKDSDGNTGNFQPYVLQDLPVNLWGRDVMEKMGVYLHSTNAAVTRQLLNQGLLPGQGLGQSNQGMVEPLQPKGNLDRAELGHF